MNIDDIRKYVVVVNGGSGCIFQPVDKEYSYILTAKHNLTDNSNRIDTLVRFQYNKNKWEKSLIEIDSLVEGRNYFSHPNKDIAILKINRITDLEPIHRIDTNDILQEPDNYCLCGYPETRRNAEKDESEKNTEDESRWYRIDQGITIKDCRNNGLREAEVPNNPGFKEIKGHSGGCIVKISGNNNLLLAGIQNKMAPAKDEALGNIQFSTIDNFDEIIEKYADCLSPLLPPYCVSFECLCNQVMQLEGCWEDISYVKSRLHEIASDIAGHPLTPLAIKNKLKTRMLVAEEKENSLYGKGLWKAWLELLIVLNIIQKEPQTEGELEDIFKQYRLIYSSTRGQWTEYLKQIACSDYRGLKENACIIVANEGIPEKTLLKKGIIPNIGQLTPRQLNIDEGTSNPFKSFKFIHIHAFQRECIVNQEEKFTIFNCEADAELLQELKRSYEDILNN